MARKLRTDGSIKAIYGFKETLKLSRPVVGNRVPAGFPSPATDYIEGNLDLNEHLVRHPAATFFVKVDGDSMNGAGMFSGDTVIVDRSLEAKNNSIVVAIYDGELTIKRLKIEGDEYFLRAENPDYKTITINKELDFYIWGVITCVIHKV